MAKGFNSRGFGGMGGGMNMNMMKQVQKMQQDMMKMQQELETKTYTAAAGGGAVSATVTGKRVLESVTIDPDAVDPEDVEMLQDMIVAAVNEALRAAENDSASSMQQLTGGLNSPFSILNGQGPRVGGHFPLKAMNPKAEEHEHGDGQGVADIGTISDRCAVGGSRWPAGCLYLFDEGRRICQCTDR